MTTTSGTKSASFRGQTISPTVLNGTISLSAIILAAASLESCMPIPAWKSPVATFSGVGAMLRAEAPTMQFSQARGSLNDSPFLALKTAWQWLS